MKKKLIYFGFALGFCLILLAAIFLFMNRFTFFEYNNGWETFKARSNRLSGKTEILTDLGWKILNKSPVVPKSDEIDLKPSLVPLSPNEINQIEFEIAQKEETNQNLETVIYNGTGKTIKNILVELAFLSNKKFNITDLDYVRNNNEFPKSEFSRKYFFLCEIKKYSSEQVYIDLGFSLKDRDYSIQSIKVINSNGY